MVQKSTMLLLVAGVLLAGSLHFAFASRASPAVPAKVAAAYARWTARFGRLRSSPEEQDFRLRTFQHNYDFVEQHNADGRQAYAVALNQFADLTDAEFAAAFANGKQTKAAPQSDSDYSASLGQEFEIVDMRGALQQDFVQASGTCNDAYAWVAAVNMNANYYLSQGARIGYTFSPQTYIDCSGEHGNNGCKGGLASNCFKYSQEWGVGTTNEYPYVGEQRPCRVVGGYFKNKAVASVPANDNAALKEIIKSQTKIVSVGVDLSSQAARFYSRGVFTGPCASEPSTHALLVGYAYDVESKNNYWLLMATFGTMWGEDGMMRLVRYTDNQGDATSSCGLNKFATYPEF